MKQALFSLFAAISMCCGTALAAYPDKPVTIVVPFAAGSATDNIARALASRLSPKLQVPVVVVNRPGANGLIGTAFGAKSDNDGYTLTAVTGTTVAQNPWMFKNLNYDPLADFQSIGLLGGFALAIVVQENSPYQTYDDLLKGIREKRGSLSYATSYGMQTVCGETVKEGSGEDVLSIPYKSSPQSIVDLIGGNLTFVCADLATALGAINSKQIRALTVLVPEGSRYLPGVKPIQESNPDFPTMQSWVGLAAPQGIAPDRLQVLSKAVYAAAQEPELAKSLSAVGFEPKPMNAADFSVFMKDEHQRWKKLIQQAGIEPQ